MDALQQHHHHQRFIRPPAPPAPPPPASMNGDSHHPSRQPLPLQGPWYSGQFQYQPPPSQSLQPLTQPPLHPAAMWPNQSDQQPSHLPPHYPSHTQQHGGNYLPPHAPPPHHVPPPPVPVTQQHPYSHPPLPPPPPPPQQHHPHGYPQQHSGHQTWGNHNWVHNQGWEHPDRSISNNNEEVWAARARAWAAAKAAMENQHLQPQFAHLGGPEDHNHVYHEQYQQVVEPHYADIQQPPLAHSSHQQLPASLVNSHGPAVNHMQEAPSFSAGPSPSYVSEERLSYTSGDGAQAADSTPAFHQRNFPTNSSVYQQEVPSSYSSVSGKEEAGDTNELFHAASSLPASSLEIHHHVQPTVTSGRSVPGELPHFTYGNHLAESMIDPSDQPLEFAPGFNRKHGSHDQHQRASYRHPDSAGSMEAPIHALTTTPVPGVVHPPVPTVPSGLQFDSSFVPPPAPGQAVPMFGQIPGSKFWPTVPPVSASYGLGAGAAPLHLPGAFPGDANGVSNVPEHPKKASVPNWLREEIIKKAVNTSSSQGHHVGDRDDSNEDGDIEKSFTKVGQIEKKINGSSLSSDDEDDDVDEVEAARTAAINQEIKRVLTEVLLKVTDELFDEIATKVLSEDQAVEVNQITPPNQKAFPSPSAVTTLKASAKVLIPVQTKDPEVDDGSEQSTSGSPGDVLGLANYASDDDEENPSSSDATTGHIDFSHLQSSDHNRVDVRTDVIENGNLQAKTDRTSAIQTIASTALHKTAIVGKGLSETKVDRDLSDGEHIPQASLKEGSEIQDGKANVDGREAEEAVDSSRPRNIIGGKTYLQSELLLVDDGRKSASHVGQGGEARSKVEKSDERVSKRSSSGKESVKQVESRKNKVDEKHSGSGEPGRDERHLRKEKMDDKNSSKERIKDQGTKSGEKAKENDFKKSFNSKDDKRESDKVKRASSKDDSGRKRDRDRDEKDSSVHHRTTRDSSRHKRRRSPSTGGRGRDGKDDSFGDHAEPSDEDSENSKQRKRNSRKRSSSPSPTRSRRRHVSRSPHSKHSQRRHSPYPSLEGTRGRRSRSNSPIRRRR